MPDPNVIKNNKSLRIFGKLLHDTNLWHLNRRSIARAVAIGFFCAFMPIPFQMVLAAALAITFRANLLFSVALVWVSNPITMPAIFYFSYKLGAIILRVPPQPFEFHLSWAWLSAKLGVIWAPLLLGSILCGFIAAIVGYCSVRIGWRIFVILHQHRRLKKQSLTNKK